MGDQNTLGYSLTWDLPGCLTSFLSSQLPPPRVPSSWPDVLQRFPGLEEPFSKWPESDLQGRPPREALPSQPLIFTEPGCQRPGSYQHDRLSPHRRPMVSKGDRKSEEQPGISQGNQHPLL